MNWMISALMKNPSHLAIAINGVDRPVSKIHFWMSGLIQRLNLSSPSSRGDRELSRKSQIDGGRGLFGIGSPVERPSGWPL
jgi:hypothetical protein